MTNNKYLLTFLSIGAVHFSLYKRNVTSKRSIWKYSKLVRNYFYKNKMFKVQNEITLLLYVHFSKCKGCLTNSNTNIKRDKSVVS